MCNVYLSILVYSLVPANLDLHTHRHVQKNATPYLSFSHPFFGAAARQAGTTRTLECLKVSYIFMHMCLLGSTHAPTSYWQTADSIMCWYAEHLEFPSLLIWTPNSQHVLKMQLTFTHPNIITGCFVHTKRKKQTVQLMSSGTIVVHRFFVIRFPTSDTFCGGLEVLQMSMLSRA